MLRVGREALGRRVSVPIMGIFPFGEWPKNQPLSLFGLVFRLTCSPCSHRMGENFWVLPGFQEGGGILSAVKGIGLNRSKLRLGVAQSLAWHGNEPAKGIFRLLVEVITECTVDETESQRLVCIDGFTL